MSPRAQVARVALAILGLPAACMRMPAVHYYTIPDLRDAPAQASSQSEGHSVRVSVKVPEELDRSELVLRLSTTEVAVDDGHRWAEPLQTALARVVTANLARDLAVAQSRSGGRGEDPPDVDVLLTVRRLDLALGRHVDLDVAWEARPSDGRVRSGGSAAHAVVAGPGYDALALACGNAVAAVSDDLSRALLQ